MEKEVIYAFLANVEYLNERMEQLASVFAAVLYSINEGAIGESEVDVCLSGVKYIVDGIKQETESLYETCLHLRKEVSA